MKDWKEEWVDMPEFVEPTRDTDKRNSIDVSDMYSVCNANTELYPKYPIYIISKGRWSNIKTSKYLDDMGIEYRVVVEECEYDKYASVLPVSKLLKLPFSDMGCGSIPARNWVLQHSRDNRDARHWILDDNISGFGLQKGGRRVSCTNGDMFRICEDFVDRYENIKLAGIRYRFHHNYVKSPYYLNTRIYSCILVDNSINHKWRGKYNEDTDLSLRVLKDGDCTMLFTWCYCNKSGTMRMKGGNTDEVYANTDNRREFAESLREQHPDVVKVVWKFNRWHHQVDYKPFKGNKLIRKDGLVLSNGINEYGMKLIET